MKPSRYFLWTTTVLMFGFPLSLPAFAQSSSIKPAAIIETIETSGSTLQVMDFLFTGDVIELAEAETLRLSYLRSCIVEEFTGAMVTVGETKSAYLGGELTFQTEVDCDGGGIVPTDRQGEDVAGLVFRIPDTNKSEPLVTVYGTDPVFVLEKPGKELVVSRQDPGSDEEHRFPINDRRVDLSEHHVQLTSGGTYVARSNEGAIAAFRISPNATAGNDLLISRLVGL